MWLRLICIYHEHCCFHIRKHTLPAFKVSCWDEDWSMGVYSERDACHNPGTWPGNNSPSLAAHSLYTVGLQLAIQAKSISFYGHQSNNNPTHLLNNCLCNLFCSRGLVHISSQSYFQCCQSQCGWASLLLFYISIIVCPRDVTPFTILHTYTHN